MIKIEYTSADGSERWIQVAEGADLVDLPDGGALTIVWDDRVPPRVLAVFSLSAEEAEREHIRRRDTMPIRFD